MPALMEMWVVMPPLPQLPPPHQWQQVRGAHHGSCGRHHSSSGWAGWRQCGGAGSRQDGSRQDGTAAAASGHISRGLGPAARRQRRGCPAPMSHCVVGACPSPSVHRQPSPNSSPPISGPVSNANTYPTCPLRVQQAAPAPCTCGNGKWRALLRRMGCCRCCRVLPSP